MKEPVLEFSDFSFQYEAQAEPTLHDINLTVHRGEKILIAGPSGCGKSTLIHAINGLIPSSCRGEIKGSCRLMGRDTREMSIFDISLHVGTVLQDLDGQFIGLTVAEDIAFALENDCIPTEEMLSIGTSILLPNAVFPQTRRSVTIRDGRRPSRNSQISVSTPKSKNSSAAISSRRSLPENAKPDRKRMTTR